MNVTIKSKTWSTLLLAAALSAASAGCDWRVFDDLKGDSWVSNTVIPSDFTSVDINAGLVPGTSGGDVGLRAFAIGKTQPQIFQLRFDEMGALLSDTDDIVSTGGASFAVRAATASDGNINALANATNATAEVIWWNAGGLTLNTITLDGGTKAPSGVAVRGDKGAAVIDDTLWSFDLMGNATAMDSCSLGTDVSALALAFVDANLVAVGQGSSLSLRDPSDCSETKVASPPGVTDLGSTLAIGDFDGDGTQDVAAGVPAQNKVLVYRNFAASNEEPEEISGPPGSRVFGHALAAGDIDGDGSDELVVGDPNATADGETNAGSAHIYVSGDLETAVTLYDASPENGQLFGSAITVAPFGSAGLGRLVVAGETELFTYFRHPINGDEDVR